MLARGGAGAGIGIGDGEPEGALAEAGADELVGAVAVEGGVGGGGERGFAGNGGGQGMGVGAAGVPHPAALAVDQVVGIALDDVRGPEDGGLQGAVRDEWFRECGSRFLRPTIELVAPRVVVALGARAYGAIMRAWSLRPEPRYLDAVELPDGTLLPCGSRVLAVYHCGSRVLNMTRRYEQQVQDWTRVARWLR